MKYIRRHGSAFISMLGGQVVPMLVTVAAFPVVRSMVGVSDFSLFVLAVSVLGFLSVIDFGLGKALVRHLVICFSDSDDSSGWAGVRTLGGGLIFSSLIYSVFGLGVYFGFPLSIEQSSFQFLFLFSIVLAPILACLVVLRAILESKQKFKMLGGIQAISGTVTYLMPMVVSLSGADIKHICWALIFGRILAVAFMIGGVCRIFSAAYIIASLRKKRVHHFCLGYAKWLAVSNISGALIVYGDRFIVANALDKAAIGGYITLVELLSKLMLVVGTMNTILFPWLTRVSETASSGSQQSYWFGVVLRFIFFFSICVLISLLLVLPVIDLLFGRAFAATVDSFALWLVFGTWFQVANAFYVNYLISVGKVRWLAILHVIELPIYLMALFWASDLYKEVGVSLVWASRMVLEFCFLVLSSQRNIVCSVRILLMVIIGVVPSFCYILFGDIFVASILAGALMLLQIFVNKRGVALFGGAK